MVVLSCIIEKDGDVSGVKVLRGLSPDLNAEAVRVMSKSPKWQAGTLHAKPVRVQNVIPVYFKLIEADLSTQGDSKIYPDESPPLEVRPFFSKGENGLNDYIGSSLHYPKNALKNNIQGRVIVSFVVNGDGSLSQFKIEHGVSPDIDAEALRVMQMSPKWLPGILNGKTVRVIHYVPIDFIIQGQSKSQTQDTINHSKIDTPTSGPVELAPSFPGGLEAFYKYLKKNQRYPRSAIQSGTEGRVIVTFVVERDGSLTDIKVKRGVSPDMDDEALRLIKESPKWRPGIQNDKPVRVQYSVPIDFKLDN
jgi:TonB family protein